jgi:NAD(P)-dependent dehydrogenase (short-subunit alcohol dehydrogenase family)
MRVPQVSAASSRLFDVEGRCYVVTGAASGLGLSITEVLIANGARVLLIDQDTDQLAMIKDRLGCQASHCAVDVADAIALHSAVQSFKAQVATIDGMFANAGISGGAGFGTLSGAISGRVQEQTIEQWDRILRVNFLGVLNSIQSVASTMKAQSRGSIVVTASIAGMRAEPFVSYAYATAKAAVIQLVRQSALELASFGVRVNAISPGFIRTRIAGGRLHDPEVESHLLDKIPMGRLGEPHEVQGLALLLASDASSYITGSIFPVDGGTLLGPSIPSIFPIKESS